MTPPSAEELRKRLIGRGTETMEVIEQRMQRAIEESDGMESYDYYVINDDLDACVDEDASDHSGRAQSQYEKSCICRQD